jgi:kinesin family protein 11
MDDWSVGGQTMIAASVKAREAIKSKLKADWTSANELTNKIAETTTAVHGETVRIVDGQMAQMDSQLVVLDEIVSRVRSQNEEHHQAHTASLGQLAGNVQASYRNIGEHFETSYSRTQNLSVDMQGRTEALTQTLPVMSANGEIRQSLHHLRSDMSAAEIEEYSKTGETPARMQYTYPTVLPRTESHQTLLDRMRGVPTAEQIQRSPQRRSPSKSKSSPTKLLVSPTKANVFADSPPSLCLTAPFSAPILRAQVASNNDSSLRELDVNVASTGVATVAAGNPGVEAGDETCKLPPPSSFKTQNANGHSTMQSDGGSRLPMKSRAARKTVAGGLLPAEMEKENINLSASVGPGTGRRMLRSRGSD